MFKDYKCNWATQGIILIDDDFPASRKIGSGPFAGEMALIFIEIYSEKNLDIAANLFKFNLIYSKRTGLKLEEVINIQDLTIKEYNKNIPEWMKIKNKMEDYLPWI